MVKAGTELADRGEATRTLGVLKTLIRPYLTTSQRGKLDEAGEKLQEELERLRVSDTPLTPNWQFSYLEILMDFARKARLLGWERPVIK